VKTARDTWYMVVRQARNLMREPIWIVMMVIQPMVWLILYGQLFKNVTRLGGFGTGSYITFLAPAIVIMNGFFGATWSGMAMINDLEHKVIERFLATPASRVSLVLSQIVRSAITAGLQGIIILIVSIALGVSIRTGALGWIVIVLTGMLWMQETARFNPVDWGVRAAREVVLPGTAWSTVGWYLLFLLLLTVLTTAWATWAFRAYQRTL